MDGRKEYSRGIIRESKNHKEQLQQVEQEVEMRNKTHKQQAISGEEENIIAKTVAEFWKEEVEQHPNRGNRSS